MLDDLRVIHERDSQDELGIAAKQGDQLSLEFSMEVGVREIWNVVLVGMGDSALSAFVAQSWPGLNVPYEIVRGYDIPSYVGEKTLFIAYSYSGDTEETISALEQASDTGALIVVITSGGKLEQVATDKGYDLLRLPVNFRPQQVLLAGLKALLSVFDAYGLTHSSAVELTHMAPVVASYTAKWLPTVATKNNLAKQIALELMGKSIVVYAGPKLAPAAYRWKVDFNKTTKQVTWWNQYPEFSHNELVGWTRQPEQKPYSVIELRSDQEHPRIQKSFEASVRLLSGLRPAPIVVNASGETLLEQLLSTIVLGDFVSLYLAILSNVGLMDRDDKDIIKRFKKELNS